MRTVLLPLVSTHLQLTNISHLDFALDHLGEKTMGSCEYGNEHSDYMERGVLDNRRSRTWLPRLWLFRISSLGDPRTQNL